MSIHGVDSYTPPARASAAQGASGRTPVEVHPELRGAFFRKIESDRLAENKGITGTVKLPEVSFDPSRQFVQTNPARAYETGPLDRPSVYMGGRAGGKELDAGLTWDRVYDERGRATYTDRANGSDGRDAAHRFAVVGSGRDAALVDGYDRVVARGQDAVDAKLRELKPNFAFRPYWRDTNAGVSEHWHNPKVGDPSNKYFYPGERVRMSTYADGPNHARLEIGVAGGPHFAVGFRQDGFGVGNAQSFKRVNAVDQFKVVNGVRSGLEGANTVRTSTRVEGARWEDVEVMQRNGSRRPLEGAFANEIRSGEHGANSVYDRIFRRTAEPNGGERIDIRPGG